MITQGHATHEMVEVGVDVLDAPCGLLLGRRARAAALHVGKGWVSVGREQ